MRLLSPPAALYSALMSLRAAAYARGIFPAWRPPQPCVSVGNIRWGGTGKTPVCSWLLDWAAEKNKQCVLLTRGYRAHPPRLPFLVEPDASPHEAGDEPLLLARANPTAKIVVDPKRVRAGKLAWTAWQPDLFVLDDGFQHMAVTRDVNLALLTLQDLETDWNRVVPSGPWREGPSALSRADAFLIKLPDLDMAKDDLREQIVRRLGTYQKPIFFFAPEPLRLTNIHTGERRDALPSQSEGRYTLFSGVADPLSVEHTATGFLGRKPVRFDAFADHHPFSAKDVIRLAQKAAAANTDHLVCTAKDAVKIRSVLAQDQAQNQGQDWWSLDMSVRFTPFTTGAPRFEDWLERRLIPA
ncbi:tetraacyldisaccharide 4'-kinase [Desulfonatronum thiodismutans]|uniref:tetraacyldisaccharide 4'-kinase n=1 Tax=Desulfonatronum thiodismutans TaxID=159290 RepID=UPI0009FE506C|nr:tetraacyldisaccharide 4'-kinase [Desulfonatronum thiodismutans]